jgi:hypothetical protein
VDDAGVLHHGVLALADPHRVVTGRVVPGGAVLVVAGLVHPRVMLLRVLDAGRREDAALVELADRDRVVAGRVDHEVGLHRDGVDAGDLARERVDRRPVHHDPADAVVLADDEVGELGHVLDARAGVAGRLYQPGAGLGTGRRVEAVDVLDRLVVDVEVVEYPLCGVPDRHGVHQKPAEPEAAAEVVVLLDDHHLHAAFGQFLGRHQPGGAAPDDDHLRVGELEEAVGPLVPDRFRHVGLAHVAEAVESVHTT